jgi:hypothetical protein
MRSWTATGLTRAATERLAVAMRLAKAVTSRGKAVTRPARVATERLASRRPAMATELQASRRPATPAMPPAKAATERSEATTLAAPAMRLAKATGRSEATTLAAPAMRLAKATGLSEAMSPATVATSPAETPPGLSKPRSPVGMETEQAGL